MPEQQPTQPPEPDPGTSPEQTTGQGPGDTQESTADQAQTQPQAPEPTASAGGRRVTRRTIDRSEVTEHTVETITEHIPVEAYQGPSSAHPGPVG